MPLAAALRASPGAAMSAEATLQHKLDATIATLPPPTNQAPRAHSPGSLPTPHEGVNKIRAFQLSCDVLHILANIDCPKLAHGSNRKSRSGTSRFPRYRYEGCLSRLEERRLSVNNSYRRSGRARL